MSTRKPDGPMTGRFAAFAVSIALTAAPALVFVIIAWSMEITGRDLNTVPLIISDVFFASGVIAPFAVPIAVILMFVLSFLNRVTIGQKVLCWAITLSAVAATLLALRTFGRIGN